MHGTKQINYGTPKHVQLKLRRHKPHVAPKRDKGAFISNESLLEDFLDIDDIILYNSSKKAGELLLKQRRYEWISKIREVYEVIIPEILEEKTYIWKIVELIQKRRKTKNKGNKTVH